MLNVITNTKKNWLGHCMTCLLVEKLGEIGRGRKNGFNNKWDYKKKDK